MQQRRLRLGDILDDYCPRERRVTNHAVVAMIEDDVKQTRCTTCDADHEYRQARVPARRRADGSALAVGSKPRTIAASSEDVGESAVDDFVPDELFNDAGDESDNAASDPGLLASPEGAVEELVDPGSGDNAPLDGEEDGPVHRRLIRATLPRPEGQAPEWKDPDFTVRQPSHGRGGFDQNRNGQRPGRPGDGGGGRRPLRGGMGNGQRQPPMSGAPRHGGTGARHGSGQPPGQGGNRPGGAGQGHGQSRGPRPPGGGRRRGR
jgi:hypothetical protein